MPQNVDEICKLVYSSQSDPFSKLTVENNAHDLGNGGIRNGKFKMYGYVTCSIGECSRNLLFPLSRVQCMMLHHLVYPRCASCIGRMYSVRQTTDCTEKNMGVYQANYRQCQCKHTGRACLPKRGCSNKVICSCGVDEMAKISSDCGWRGLWLRTCNREGPS